MLNVFHRDGDTIRHFWGSELFYAPTEPGQDPRHVGTLEPVWNLFDLTPEGRPTDWDEQLSYSLGADLDSDADGEPPDAPAHVPRRTRKPRSISSRPCGSASSPRSGSEWPCAG